MPAIALQNADALAACNATKRAHASQGPAAYWDAKNEFFAGILEAGNA